MRSSDPATLVVAVLIVLAGCGSTLSPTGESPATDSDTPTATASPDGTDRTQTATPDATPPSDPRTLAATYNVSVENGELPVNYSLVYARTALALDRGNVSAPTEVEIRADARMPTFRTEFSEFERLVGLQLPPGRSTTFTAAAYVSNPTRVTVNRQLLDEPNTTEYVLAHESVHVVQFATGAVGRMREGFDAEPSEFGRDRDQIVAALIEGSATWVETRYWETHVATGPNPRAELAADFRNGTASQRLSLAPYYYGSQYVRGRLDDPGKLDRVYENPPRTSEELLHGLPPGSEPPAAINVTDETGDDWESVPESRTRMGELFLRVAWSSELSLDRAAEAADGWGNDRRLTFERGSDTGHVWVHRWDDTANASEFVRLTETFLNRSANRTTLQTPAGNRTGWQSPTGTYRLVRFDDRTTVLLMGDRAFVGNATLGGTPTNVSVTDGSAASPASVTTDADLTTRGPEPATAVTGPITAASDPATTGVRAHPTIVNPAEPGVTDAFAAR